MAVYLGEEARMRARVAVLAAVVAMSGCGAGPESEAGVSTFPVSGAGAPSPAPVPAPPPLPVEPPPSGEAQGFWSGSTSTGRYFAALVTAAGDVWGLYGNSQGVAQGTIKARATATSGGQLQASGTDYFIGGGRIYSITMTGTFSERGRMTGSYTGGAPGTFTATYDSRFDVPAQISDVAGTWRVRSESTAGSVTTTISIDGAGNVSARSPLCQLVGTVAPASGGKGYFVTSTSFSGGQCPWAGLTLPGVAVRAVIQGVDRLTLASVSADGSTGFVATGTR